MFVRTADDNYIVARRCCFEHFEVDFCWLAVHALEKYLKAVLLMNGRSSKGPGHDITKLYEQVKEHVATEFLSTLAFEKPANWNRFWRDETPEVFLLAFAPPEYEQPRGFIGSSMRRSVLMKEILRPVCRSPQDHEFLDSLVNWVIANIHLPKDVQEELRDKVFKEGQRLASLPTT